MRPFLLVALLSGLCQANVGGNFLHSRSVRQAYGNPEPVYPAANYAFDWQVRDGPSGNDYGHTETRKDQQTQGSYHVALPDGRIQTVKYAVDGYGGYVAEVTYDGQAVYPEARPYSAPAPYQQAAPVVIAPTPYAPVAIAAPAYRPQPAPAPYQIQPSPAPYRPQPTPAPYRPQPIQPYAAASGQTATYSLPPATPAPSVRRYTFRTASEIAPAKPESEAIVETSEPIAVAASFESAPAQAEILEPRISPVEEVSVVSEIAETTTYSPPEELSTPALLYYYRS